MTDTGLLELHQLVQALKATTKSTEKVKLLQEAPESVHKWLLMTYDKVGFTFHLTSKGVKKQRPMLDTLEVYQDLERFLTELNAKGSASDKDAYHLKAVMMWVSMDLLPEEANFHTVETLYSILDRDLGCGISAKTINKAIPGLIPTFPVALGEPIKRTKKVKGELVLVDSTPDDLFEGGWYVSRKLDGIRCVVICDKGKVTCHTRKGRILKTTAKLEEAFAEFADDGIVFDGELCIVDANGDEDYKAITQQYNRKDHTLTEFKYKVFDVLLAEEFWGREESSPFSDRVEVAEFLIRELASPHVDCVQQEKLVGEIQYQVWKDRVALEGWEGLIIRNDTVYFGDRSKDILKVKEFFDDEFEITGFDIGPFTIRVGGKESVIETIVGMKIEYKGNPVGVGSGFTMPERTDMLKNPDKYLGKKATIRYFEISEDKEGRPSLRFPVYKGLRKRGE